MQLCHVKGCQEVAAKIEWVPQLGAPLCLCEKHDSMPSEGKAGLIIDAARARADYILTMESMIHEPSASGEKL